MWSNSTFIGTVTIATIAILVLLPTSLSLEKFCDNGPKDCPKNMVCVWKKANWQVCMPPGKVNNVCSVKKNKKGVWYILPPCGPKLYCNELEKGKYKGNCDPIETKP